MHIHFHEPWKKSMSIKYQEILSTFSRTCERHKQLENELKKQIDVFIDDYKKSLGMLYSSYYAPNDTISFFSGARNEPWERKEKITATLGYVEPHTISGADIDTRPILCIPFTLTTVIGGDTEGDPFVSLDTPMKFGKKDDLLIVMVGEKSFVLPVTNNLPQFSEVCEYIKLQLNERCKG